MNKAEDRISKHENNKDYVIQKPERKMSEENGASEKSGKHVPTYAEWDGWSREEKEKNIKKFDGWELAKFLENTNLHIQPMNSKKNESKEIYRQENHSKNAENQRHGDNLKAAWEKWLFT